MSVKTWDLLSFDQGTVALVVRDDRLCRICFVGSAEEAASAVSRHCPDARRSSSRLAKEVFVQLQEYFSGARKTFDVRLDDSALSDFACKVHKALSQVPYGSLVRIVIWPGWPAHPVRHALSVGSCRPTLIR